MRSGVVLLASLAALLVLSTASGSRTTIPHAALYPNAVAFADRMHGELGTGYPSGHVGGAVEATSDGGQTWHVIRRTTLPVVALAYFHDAYYAQLSNGRLISGQPGGDTFKPRCAGWYGAGYSANIVDTNLGKRWSICVSQGGAGNEAKAVYRGTSRVAYTPFTGGVAQDGIPSYGYPQGIAGSYGGFGLIWEWRGTLYVTRDGGYKWHGLPTVAVGEVDFGSWATVLSGRVGYVLLERNQRSRLIQTTDAGRTWQVVHRWSSP